MASDRAELRVEVPREELAVLDGYCSATGRDRSDVVRQILREWSDRKHREAILICRVAGGNPSQADPDRNPNVSCRTNPGSET